MSTDAGEINRCNTDSPTQKRQFCREDDKDGNTQNEQPGNRYQRCLSPPQPNGHDHGGRQQYDRITQVGNEDPGLGCEHVKTNNRIQERRDDLLRVTR